MKIDIVIPTYKRPQKVERCVKSILQSDYDDYQIVIINDAHQKMAFGIWNNYLVQTGYDTVLCLCDDTEVLPGTLSRLAECMVTKFPDRDGVVGLNQINIKNGSPYAMVLIGKAFAERFPYHQCFCPLYTSFHADTELGQYAEEEGRFVFCKEAQIKHYHPSFYPNEKDETHNLVRTYKERDAATNTYREKNNLLWGRDFVLIKQ